MVWITATFAALLVVALGGVDARSIVNRHISLTPRSSTPAVIPHADFTVALSGKQPRSKAKKAAFNNLRPVRHHGSGSQSTVVPLAASDFVDEYLVNVTVGGQRFAMIVDTGSSDTWTAMKGFQCLNADSQPQPEATCNFGTGGFDPTKSKTFQTIPNRNFNITYGDGEFLTGTAARETIGVGGMTVTKQEIGLVTHAFWEGDTVNTGLMGLAYPGLTSIFFGNDPDADKFPQDIYSPLFFTAVQEGAVNNPFFSISLDRGTLDQQNNDIFDPNFGFLAFGGLPPVPVTKNAATVPVQGYNAATGDVSNAKNATFFFYTVDVQSYTFPGSKALHTANNDTIVDSGTTLNFLPTDIVAAYNAEFVPPAVIDPDFGLFTTTCTAKVPSFSVTLGGKTFPIDGRDQLLPIGLTDANGNELCITGTQDGGPAVDGNIFILGDVFLHNVVTSFNIKTNELTFTQRQPY